MENYNLIMASEEPLDLTVKTKVTEETRSVHQEKPLCLIKSCGCNYGHHTFLQGGMLTSCTPPPPGICTNYQYQQYSVPDQSMEPPRHSPLLEIGSIPVRAKSASPSIRYHREDNREEEAMDTSERECTSSSCSIEPNQGQLMTENELPMPRANSEASKTYEDVPAADSVITVSTIANASNNVSSNVRASSLPRPPRSVLPNTSFHIRNIISVKEDPVVNKTVPTSTADDCQSSEQQQQQQHYQAEKSEDVGKENVDVTNHSQPGVRMTALDYLISKVLVERIDVPFKPCNTEIKKIYTGERKGRLRLMDLIELQVEESLKV